MRGKYAGIILTAVFLCSLAAIILAMRMHFIALPLDRDEGAYAYIAWRMDYGEMPYRDIFDHKPPVIYFLYNIAFKMFGVNYTAIRGFSALYVILIMLAVFFTAKRHFGLKAAAAAAALFSVYQGSVLMQGINANTELFLLLPLILALYFGAGGKKYEYFLSGLFFSAAVFTKQAVVFGAFIWVAYWIITRKRENALLFVGGAFVFAAVILAWLAANGLVPYFMEYVVIFNGYYAWLNIKFRLPVFLKFLRENAFLMASYLYLLFLMFRKEKAVPEVLLFWLLTGLCTGIIMIGGMYEHYYLVLYAPLCISAGLMAARMTLQKGVIKKAAAVSLLVLLFAVTFSAFNYELYRQPFKQVTKQQYGYTFFYETPIISQKINEIKKPDTTLFVWPSAPEIYFYTGIKSMFRQMSVLPVYAMYYRDEANRLLADVEKAGPDLIVINTKEDAPAGWVRKDYEPVMMTENHVLLKKK